MFKNTVIIGSLKFLSIIQSDHVNPDLRLSGHLLFGKNFPAPEFFTIPTIYLPGHVKPFLKYWEILIVGEMLKRAVNFTLLYFSKIA